MKNQEQKIQSYITEEMKCFPIPPKYRDRVVFEDTFGAERTGGSHEGCDLMDVDNIPGDIPIVSATDGEITNMGWLFLGGYRIGVTSKSGTYYYYAHFTSYAKGLQVGDKVCAGQLLGFMGDTGQGEEGTRGKFPVHLHFGIYRYDDGEKAINSYPYLVLLK